MARISTIYTNIADGLEGGIDQGTQHMVSTLKGFNMSADKAEHIADVFNEVGNKYAISSGGIGEAIQRGGSAMFAANNSLEQSVAMVVAANDSIQDESRVGNAMKTISMRLRGAGKETLAEAGIDTTGMSTRKDLVKIMKNVAGVDLLQDGSTFKSTYDVLDELAGKWSELSDLQRATIQEQAAGKSQGAVFASLMTNWEDARKAFQTAQDAEGSAVRENEIFLSSIAGRKKQFSAAFENLSTDFINTDAVKIGIQAGTGIINGLDTIISHTPGGLLGLGAIGGLTSFGVSAAKVFGTAFKNFFVSSQGSNAFKSVGYALKQTFSATAQSIGELPVWAKTGLAIGGAVALGVAAYKIYDANTTDYGEIREQVYNDTTAANSARAQIETINSQIEANEATIRQLRDQTATTSTLSQISSLERENDNLKSQRRYQETIADIKGVSAASAAISAMQISNAYTGAGKRIEGVAGFKQLITEVGDSTAIQQTRDLYNEQLSYARAANNEKQIAAYQDLLDKLDESEAALQKYNVADAFDNAIDDYQTAQKTLKDVLEETPEEGKFDEWSDRVSAAQNKVDESGKIYQEQLADLYAYRDALLDENGNVVRMSGAQDAYDLITQKINQSTYKTSGAEALMDTLLNQSQYKRAKDTIEEMFKSGEKGIDVTSKGFKGLFKAFKDGGGTVEEFEAIIVKLLSGQMIGTISLVEDNLAQMSEAAKIAEKSRAAQKTAISEAYSGSGLTNESYTEMYREGYSPAMQFTSTGIALDYRKYQKLREQNQNQEKYQLEQEIKDNIAEIARLKTDRSMARSPERIAQIDSDLQIAQQNLRNAQAAKSMVYGQYSGVAEFIDSLSSGYSIASTTDALASGIAAVQKTVKEGKTSDASVREFAELYTGKDLSGTSNRFIGDYYESALKNAKKFFNVDDDGNIKEFSSTKFADQIKQASEALGIEGAFDEAHKSMKLNSSDLMNIAKWAGVSKEAIVEMAKSMNAYGWDVEIDDTAKSLSDYADSAEEATEKINKSSSKYLQGYTDKESGIVYNEDSPYVVKQGEELETMSETVTQLDRLAQAREKATEAGDTEALEDLNTAYIDTLQRQEELGRGDTVGALMDADASQIEGSSGDVIESLQNVRKAYEELRTGTKAADQGIDVNLNELAGQYADAQENLASLIFGDADLTAQLSEYLGKDLSGADFQGILDAITPLDSFALISALFPDGIADALQKMLEEGSKTTDQSEGRDEAREEKSQQAHERAQQQKQEERNQEIDAQNRKVAEEQRRARIIAEQNKPIDASNRRDAEIARYAREHPEDQGSSRGNKIATSDASFGKDLEYMLSEGVGKLGNWVGEQFSNNNPPDVFNPETAEQTGFYEDGTLADNALSTLAGSLDANTGAVDANTGAITGQTPENEPLNGKEIEDYGNVDPEVAEMASAILGLNPDYFEKGYNNTVDSLLQNAQDLLNSEISPEQMFESMGLTYENIPFMDRLAEIFGSGEVPDSVGDTADATGELADAASDLGSAAANTTSKIEETSSAIEGEGETVEVKEPEIKEISAPEPLTSTGNEVITTEVVMTADDSEVEEAKSEAEEPVEQPVTQRVEQVIDSVGDVDGVMNNLPTETQAMAIDVVANVTGDEELATLKDSEDGLYDKIVEVTAQAIGTGDVDTLISVIASLSGKEVEAVANAYGASDVWSIVAAVDSMHDKEITVTTNYVTKGTPPPGGTQMYNGTAHFGGSAYARGTWGTESTEHNVLAGEFGKEGILYPNGTYREVGANGPEIIKTLPKGSTVFNHKQWANIKHNSYIAGKAHFAGTAYASGTSDANKYVDFVERLLKRLSTSLTRLKDQADSYDDYTKKNKYLNKSLDQVSKNLKENKSAYNAYMKQAKSVGLDEKYAKKVRDGSMDISKIEDDKLREKIQDYTKWYDKAQSVKDTITDLNKELVDLNKQKLDSITNYFNTFIDRFQSMADLSDSRSSFTEAQRGWGSASDLRSSKTYIRRQIAQMEKEYNAYNKEFQTQRAAGNLTPQQIAEYRKTLSDIRKSIIDANSELISIDDKIKDVANQRFSAYTTPFDAYNDYLDQYAARWEAESAYFATQHGGRESPHMIRKAALHQNTRVKNLEDTIAAAEHALEISLENGDIHVGDEEYTQMMTQLEKYRTELANAKKSVADLNAKLLEINWTTWERGIDVLNHYQNSLSSMLSLIDDFNKFNSDNAKITEYGSAALNLYSDSMLEARNEVSAYQKAITQLNKEYADGQRTKEDYDAKYRELYEGELAAAQKIQSARRSIIEIVRKGIEAETNAMSKLIDKRKEALQRQKEADDYARKVRDQNKDILNIQRQIAALSGDDTEATRAKIRKLSAELADKQEDLAETQRDHEYEVLSQGLDDELAKYKETQDEKIEALTSSLEYQDKIIKDALDVSTGDFLSSFEVILGAAREYGISVPEAFTSNFSKISIGTQKQDFETVCSDILGIADKYGINISDAMNKYFNRISMKGVRNEVEADIASIMNKIAEASQEVQNFKTSFGDTRIVGENDINDNDKNAGKDNKDSNVSTEAALPKTVPEQISELRSAVEKARKTTAGKFASVKSAQEKLEPLKADYENLQKVYKKAYIAKYNDTKVRATPDNNGKVIGTIKKGATVQITGKKSGNWYQVSYNGKTGWVHANNLEQNSKLTKSEQSLLSKGSSITSSYNSAKSAYDKALKSYNSSVASRNEAYKALAELDEDKTWASKLQAYDKAAQSIDYYKKASSNDYIITAASTALRKTADAKGEQLIKLYKGDDVFFTGKTSGDWMQVTYGKSGGSHITGWIRKSQLQARYDESKLSLSSFSSLKSLGGYINGTRSASSGIALMDESGFGTEALLTKKGVLRQFGSGDMVFNSAQRNMLWNLSKMDIPSILSGMKSSIGTLVGAQSPSITVQNNYDSLITVEGNVDKDTLPSLEQICIKACEYTKKDIKKTMTKFGWK